MSNIPSRSPSLWAHLICAYLFTFVVLIELRRVNETVPTHAISATHTQYLRFRIKTFEQRNDQAVLVQGLPPNVTAETVLETFKKTFPDVADARLVYDCRELELLLEQHDEVRNTHTHTYRNHNTKSHQVHSHCPNCTGLDSS